ncbi:septum formation family protein [Schumannella soli]|uniref:Septum formation-related domain-containing protein n=1 Tax=Schumannella soli TaxID=2590779 RepID=A0A506Y1H4_9MICO|nr:septum formation family protein [Schumannella soli]TPW74798.1 hypothetical protein FJ657_14595 [Schumannella soli]
MRPARILIAALAAATLVTTLSGCALIDTARDLGRALGGGGAPGSGGSVDPDYDTALDELEVGDCFLEPDDDIETAIVDCSDEHDYEVTALVTLEGVDYPGDIKVDKLSRALCSQALTDYVGIPYSDSSLESWAWTPDEDGWADGDHVAVCTATDYYYDVLDQSVKDARI